MERSYESVLVRPSIVAERAWATSATCFTVGLLISGSSLLLCWSCSLVDGAVCTGGSTIAVGAGGTEIPCGANEFTGANNVGDIGAAGGAVGVKGAGGAAQAELRL